MAAELTSFDKAMRETMAAMLEDQFGKPYPGPGHIVELTAKQRRENAEWRDREQQAVEWANERHADIFTEAKERFGISLSEDEGGGISSYDTEPHSPTFVPDDRAAYDQWRRDHPGMYGRFLFALEKQ